MGFVYEFDLEPTMEFESKQGVFQGENKENIDPGEPRAPSLPRTLLTASDTQSLGSTPRAPDPERSNRGWHHSRFKHVPKPKCRRPRLWI